MVAVVRDTLPGSLRQLLRSGTDTNPALNTLLDDYKTYHLALLVVGGLFLAALLVLAIIFWTRFKRARVDGTRKWSFERKTYFSFGILSVLVCLFLGVVVAANLSTVLNPRQGFAASVNMLSPNPSAGSPAAELYGSVNTWLQSGSTEVPPVLQQRIDDRLSWQRPKAVICSALLVIFVVASGLIWRALIRRSRDGTGRWGPKRAALFIAGVLTVGSCLMLMLMVMGNVQASFAPISLTLFFN